MTFDYARAQATATRLLTNFGADATLRKQVQGAYDPATGTTTVTTTDYTVKAALLNYSRMDANNQNAEGTLVERDDRKIIIESFAAVPDTDDLIIFGSVTYRVVSVKKVNPSGTVVIHELQARI